MCGLLCLISANAMGRVQSPLPVAPEGPERFEVSVIRPMPPVGSHAGFTAYPGSVDIGAKTLVDLIALAYDCRPDQIDRGPAWVRDIRFDIEAKYVPKESEVSLGMRYDPTPAERHMLQHMLTERFGLRLSTYSKPSPVLFLLKTGATTQLQPTQHADVHPGASFMISSQGVATGDAMGRNITMDNFAHQIGVELSVSVVDRTGLTAAYDFRVHAPDPNSADEMEGVSTSLRMLGLGLKKGTAPDRHWAITAVSQPDQN